MGRRALNLAGCGLCLTLCTGCHRGAPVPYEDWRLPSPEVSAGSNAFDAYAEAGRSAAAKGEKWLKRVSFTGSDFKEMDKTIAPEVARVLDTAGSGVFRFSTRLPFEADPMRLGWRLIGRDLVWRIQQAIAIQDFDTAVRLTIATTRFGFAIAGGDVSDALLGFPLIDEVRSMVAGSLPDMGAGQLHLLVDGLTTVYRSRPSASSIVGHEHETMRADVQFVQEQYRSDRLSDLQNRLGATTKDSIAALQSMRDRDEGKRVEFFKQFAAEADAEASWLMGAIALPTAKRLPEPQFKGGSKRPWHAIAIEFVGTGAPFLSALDQTMAKTRLFILTASILGQVKVQGAPPANLRGFPSDLTQDPYTGSSLLYVPRGKDFVLYSAGPNLQDDGGDIATDTFLEGR